MLGEITGTSSACARGKRAGMSKVNSGWVRKQTAALLSMTLALAPVAAVPALAADVDGGSDAALEQPVETEGEKDVEDAEQSEKDAVQNVEAEKDVEPTSDNSFGLVDENGSEPVSIAPRSSSTDDAGVTREASAAVVISADGSVETGYGNARDAAKALQDGETLVLNEDYVGDWGLTVRAANATIDLNGHSVTSNKKSTSASYGYAIKAEKPSTGVTNHTLTIKNSAQTQSVLSSSAYQVTASSGDSRYAVTVVFEGDIAFRSTKGEDALGVNLGTGARIADGELARSAVANGGFLASTSDGSSYIYGSYANAAAASADATVTMLHDYTGTAKISSGDRKATLDLGGCTYTYTGGEAIADVNYDGASLTIKNGALTTTSASADGVIMLDSNSALVLDGVKVEVPKGSYGIVTNGQETNNAITLRNSELTVTEGAGIYFPSTGSVTIDDSVITAKTTGVQLCAGNLTVQGDKTAITVTGQPETKTENDGVIPDGAAISIVKRAGYQSLGTVSVKGGTFKSANDVDAIKAYAFNNTDKKEQTWGDAGQVVAVSGGSFSTSVPQGLCADGLKPVKVPGGSFTVVAQDMFVTVSDEQGNVLSVYKSLSAAIAAAGEGQTVALLDDVTESVTVPDGKNLTLDLAGHKLTNTDGQHTVTVNEGAKLTVTDSSVGKAGVIDNVSHGKAALFNDQDGTVVLNGGTFNRSKENGFSAVQSGGNSFYTLQNYGSMTINEGVTVRQGSNEEGGKFSSLIENGWYNGNNNASKAEATMVINGGSFVGGLNTIKNDDWGVLTIKGGSFTNTAQAAVLNWNKTTITGGEFQSDQYAVLNGKLNDSMDVGELVIEGGSFTGGNGYEVVSQMSSSTPIGSVAISGGEFWTAPDEEFIVPGSGLTQNSDGSFGIHEHIGMAVAAKDPTCTEAGNKAYWECSECHELFLDKAMTQPTTREDVTIAATDHQHVTHVEAKDATETETGNLEYWYCADCGRYFSDAALSQETTLAELTIPAKGQEPADKPKDEDVEKDDSLAQTGDATAVAPLVASAVAGVSALAAGAVTLRKRK